MKKGKRIEIILHDNKLTFALIWGTLHYDNDIINCTTEVKKKIFKNFFYTLV